jgi:pimeloyl-ACP methyl ester carboxylesterase
MGRQARLATLVLALAATTGCQDDRSEIVLEVDGAELTAVSWGSGQTVLALPGSGLDVSWFELLGPKVAEAGYRFVAVNPRGIDGSTGTLAGLTLDILARDVAGAVEEVNVEQAHLVGWAFGNRVARAVAANHPNRVATVILLAAGGKIPPTQATRDAQNRLDTEPNLPDSTRARLLRETRFSPASDPLAITASVGTGVWSEAREAQRATRSGRTLASWWPGGSKPLLVVQGEDDMTAPPANGLALQDEFPDRVELVELEGAGHFLLVEKPAEVAEVIVSYLRRHPIVEIRRAVGGKGPG